MNLLKNDMIEILKDLKENHHVLGVKAEFETEGTTFQEAVMLKEIVTKAGLDLTIKIGGCAAVKDMIDTEIIGAHAIVAPMIESCYAVEKFIESAKQIFDQDVKYYINIETITGVLSLKEILQTEASQYLAGIILGRTDLCGSLEMKNNQINDEIILKHAQNVSKYCVEYNKEFIIGGGVNTLSIPFFKQLFKLTKFETRKIIFDAQSICDEEGILKALDFELLWLKNKHDFYNKILSENSKRIELLKSRNTDNFMV